MGLLDDAIREHLELKRRRGADAGDISRQESEALGPVQRGPDGAPDLPATFTPPDEPIAEAPAAPATYGDEPTQALSPPAPPGYEPPADRRARAAARARSTARTQVRASARDAGRRAAACAGGLRAAAAACAYEPPPTAAYEPPAAPAYQPRRRVRTAAARQRPCAEHAPSRPISELQSQNPTTRRCSSPNRDPEHEPEPEPEPEPESHSLFSRLRVGRKSTRPSEPDPPRRSGEPAAYEPPAEPEPDVEDVLEETPDFLEETPEHDRLWFEQRPPRDFDFDDK